MATTPASSMLAIVTASLLLTNGIVGAECEQDDCTYQETDLLSAIQINTTAPQRNPSPAHRQPQARQQLLFLEDPQQGLPAFPGDSFPANASFLSKRLASQRGDCANPPGVTCQCPNPDFPCRKSSGGGCACFSHSTQDWCESDAGFWCTRPDSCVDYCELCETETACSQCAAGYMLLYGHCTKMPDNEMDRWLKAHNLLRCVHGSPPLTWSSAAADSAAAWADHLAEIDTMVHADSYNEGPPAGPAGENLAWNYGTAEAATTGWYSEVECCDALPGCDSGSCTTGHFTAMIWQGVQGLGCASSGKYQVCRYRSGDALDCNTANMPGCHEEMVVGQVAQLQECIDSYDTDVATTTTQEGGNATSTTVETFTPPMPGSSTLPSCAPPSRQSRAECETCFQGSNCGADFKCHKEWKICVAKHRTSICETPKAGCPQKCSNQMCNDAEGCDCQCTLVGEDKVYSWMVWANLGNPNSTSPTVTCAEES